MKVEIKTVCPAYVYETWQIDVPGGLTEDELREAAHEALVSGDAELIGDSHSDVQDREVVSVVACSASAR